MVVSVLAAIIGGLFTAWVIGANSASPSFGPVTSAGAANVFRSSLIVGVAAMLGAVTQGTAVADTIGTQLVSGVSFTVVLAAVTLLTASLLILGSILFEYPMPTAFTLVGSALGTGVAAGGVPQWPQLQEILLFWLFIPVFAGFIGFAVAWGLRRFVPKTERNVRMVRWALLGLGAFTAYTAGANQAGLVIGPLIGAFQAPVAVLLVFGGAGMLVGAWTGSPRIISAVSTEYSMMGPRRAVAALAGASLLAQVATLYGVPVSFNEAVIAAVIGSGLVEGRAGVGTRKILVTVGAWIGGFAVAFGAAYTVTTVIQAL